MKKIIEKVKLLTIRPKDRPAIRWTSSRLNEVKTYLEAKDTELWTREDHYLAVEFVVQRYLPADADRTQAEYDSALKGMKDKIDRNIDFPDAPREEVKDDPDFAAWLDQHLSSK